MAETRTVSEHIPEHKVVRDSNFLQFYADATIAIKAPRNLELSFIKVESILTDCSVEEDSEVPDTFRMAPSVREVGRATIPVSVAFGLAIDILEEIAPSGAINLEAFNEKISDLTKEIAASAERRRDRK